MQRERGDSTRESTVEGRVPTGTARGCPHASQHASDPHLVPVGVGGEPGAQIPHLLACAEVQKNSRPRGRRRVRCLRATQADVLGRGKDHTWQVFSAAMRPHLCHPEERQIPLSTHPAGT